MFPYVSPEFNNLIYFSSPRKITHSHYLSLQKIDIAHITK